MTPDAGSVGGESGIRPRLPDSWEEKKEAPGMQHWIFVHELQKLLLSLEPDDWLTPNQVGNLCIGRGDNHNIGIINLHRTYTEWWNDERE